MNIVALSAIVPRLFLCVSRGIVWSHSPNRHILWFMDRLTPERRSWLMSRVRGRDTKPERIVRGLVRKLGLRPKLNAADLPGKPDLAFPKRKKAIFVHGCFWHRHSGCKYATIPKTRRAFWSAKFAANVVRDRRVRRQLRVLGFSTLVVWQCRTKRPAALAKRLEKFLAE